MATSKRTPFSPTGDYVVTRKFKYLSVDYKPGDVFDWRKMNTPHQKLEQLFEGHFIDHKDEPKKGKTMAKKPVEEEVEDQVNENESDSDEEDEQDEADDSDEDDSDEDSDEEDEDESDDEEDEDEPTKPLTAAQKRAAARKKK